MVTMKGLAMQITLKDGTVVEFDDGLFLNRFIKFFDSCSSKEDGIKAYQVFIKSAAEWLEIKK